MVLPLGGRVGRRLLQTSITLRNGGFFYAKLKFLDEFFASEFNISKSHSTLSTKYVFPSRFHVVLGVSLKFHH